MYRTYSDWMVHSVDHGDFTWTVVIVIFILWTVGIGWSFRGPWGLDGSFDGLWEFKWFIPLIVGIGWFIL